MGQPVTAIQFKCSFQLRDGFVVSPCEREASTILTVSAERERVYLQRLPKFGQRFSVSAEICEQFTVILVRVSIVRIQFDGTLELAFRPGEIVIVFKKDAPECGVR